MDHLLLSFQCRVNSKKNFGFKTPEHALNYYRRGADQLYLYLGNNVFSYDNDPILQFLGDLSRTLEQSAAIILGLHPEIRIVPTDTNKHWIDYLFFRRTLFLTISAIFISAFITLFVLIRRYKGEIS